MTKRNVDGAQKYNLVWIKYNLVWAMRIWGWKIGWCGYTRYHNISILLYLVNNQPIFHYFLTIENPAISLPKSTLHQNMNKWSILCSGHRKWNIHINIINRNIIKENKYITSISFMWYLILFPRGSFLVGEITTIHSHFGQFGLVKPLYQVLLT